MVFNLEGNPQEFSLGCILSLQGRMKNDGYCQLSIARHWTCRIFAKSLSTSDLAAFAQLFARCKTELSNVRGTQHIGLLMAKINPWILRYIEILTPKSHLRLDVNVPPVNSTPKSLCTSENFGTIRGMHYSWFISNPHRGFISTI